MGAVRDVLRRTDVRRLEFGWGLSVVGELAGTVAVAIYAFGQGGAGLVGVYGLARTLPAALVAPLVMGLSDRMPRERLLRLATVVRALLLSASALVGAARGPASLVIGLAAASSALASTYRPLLVAILPWLVRSPAELGAVNVLATTMENSGALAGPVLAAALLTAGPAWVAMAAAAGFLAVAAAQVWRVDLHRQHVTSETGGTGLVREVLTGLLDLSRVASPAGITVLLFAQTFVKGALTVLVVVLAVDVTGAGESAVGWLYAVMGLGGLVGGAVAAAVVRANRLGRAFVTGLLLWGLPLALLAPAPGLVACVVALGVVGAGNAIQDVGGGTLTPRLFSPTILGRVLGAEELVVFAGGGAGAAAAAPLIGVIGPRGTLAAIGLGLVAVTLIYAVRFVQIDRATPDSGPRVELIRGLAIFAPLPLAAVDLLASRLTPREYPAGAVVIREGASGDDYQLIVEGSASVSVRGFPRRDLGPGDGFGEIALLRSIPRTATITTVEPLHTLSLKRDDFLAAVTGHPSSAATAASLVQETLDRDPRDDAGD
ncbi:MAG: cyclic nucleotide-binding domain-containing protein [Kineosporiaceae bacterium]|jgi:MFS family permease